MDRSDLECAGTEGIAGLEISAGVLQGQVLSPTLDEQIGEVAFHKLDGLGGALRFIQHDEDDCLSFTGPSELAGNVALLELEPLCGQLLPEMAKELSRRGAVFIIVDAEQCLCEELENDSVFENPESCTELSCLRNLQPRGSPEESPGLVAPVVTLTRSQFGLLSDCLGHTDLVNDTATQDACTSEVAELAWIFDTSEQVEMEIFTQPGESENVFKRREFSEGILPVLDQVHAVSTWTFTQIVIDGTVTEIECDACGDARFIDCTDSMNSGTCLNGCTNGGRYCLPDAQVRGEGEGVIAGYRLVQETLRQACAWQQVEADRSKFKAFLRYLGEVEMNCFGSSISLSAQCSREILDRVELDPDSVDSCTLNSGGAANDYSGQFTGVNSVLESLKATRQQYIENQRIFKSPSISVNGKTIPFGNEWGTSLSGICASTTSTFDFCDCIYDAERNRLKKDVDILRKCFKYDSRQNSVRSQSEKLVLGLSITCSLLAVSVLGAFYLRRGRNAMISSSSDENGMIELADLSVPEQSQSAATTRTNRAWLPKFVPGSKSGGATGASASKYPSK